MATFKGDKYYADNITLVIGVETPRGEGEG